MKQLANDYEAGNWSPFGETGGKVEEDRPDEGDTKDKGAHASLVDDPIEDTDSCPAFHADASPHMDFCRMLWPAEWDSVWSKVL